MVMKKILLWTVLTVSMCVYGMRHAEAQKVKDQEFT